MTKKEEQKEQQLPIKWNIPDNMIARFATNIVVQTIENEFKISFFEIQPPIILSDKDRENVKKLGTIRADCLGTIIVTPDRMQKFIQLMNEQLSRYNNSKQQKKILTPFPSCFGSLLCYLFPSRCRQFLSPCLTAFQSP